MGSRIEPPSSIALRLLLNTLALKIYYGIPFVPMIYLRAVLCVVLIVTEITVLWLVLVVLDLPSRLKKN